MDRLKSFEGIPHPYDKKKRVVIPAAIKHLRMKPTRKFCMLGDLATKVGWKQHDIIKRLNAKRVVKSKAYFAKKQAEAKSYKAAVKSVSKDLDTKVLEPAGF